MEEVEKMRMIQTFFILYLNVVILAGVHLPPLLLPHLYQLWCTRLTYFCPGSLAAGKP